MQCSFCEHWISVAAIAPKDSPEASRDDMNQIGFCRRYPPQIITITTQNPLSRNVETQIQARYPNTTAKDLCGEYQANNDPRYDPLG